MPRHLTTLERQVIEAVIIDEYPGASELRLQLATASVASNWKPDGSPSIYLIVSPDAPAIEESCEILPVDVDVHNEHGEYLGELILWLSNGRIFALEYAWVTEICPLLCRLSRCCVYRCAIPVASIEM